MSGEDYNKKIEKPIDDIIWEYGCLFRSMASIFNIKIPDSLYVKRYKLSLEAEESDETGKDNSDMDWDAFMSEFIENEMKRIRDLQDDPECPTEIKNARFKIEKCHSEEECMALLERSKGVMFCLPPSFFGPAHVVHIVLHEGKFMAISDEEAWEINFDDNETANYLISVN